MPASEAIQPTSEMRPTSSHQDLDHAAALEAHDDNWRPRFNPWLVAFTVTLATFMEALDSSIANVALPHIAGTLSASQDESTWVLTSYLVSNAVVLPISGWLSNRLGRKRFYMSCVALFTATSFLCGLAPSLGMLVLFRIIQGAAGGGLQPSERAILADTFAPEKRSMAFAIYGMAVVLAPAIGPTLGGWITDNYSWRWIFFLNIPVGIISLLLTQRIVEDPPYLKRVRKLIQGVDYYGLGLLVVFIGALQFMLDKGQENDWFSSRLIVACAVISAAGFLAFLWRELHTEHPIVDLRLYKLRNFATTQFVMLMIGISLYSTTVLIPQFLQQLMGYSAEQAGLALSSGGLVLIVLFPVAGFLGQKLDPRLLTTIGFILLTYGLYRITNISLGVSFATAVSWRVVMTIGMPFLFVPISVMTYVGVPREKNNEVSGLTALARNLGGSIGISAVTTLLVRRQQAHQTYLSAHLNDSNSAYTQQLAGIAAALRQRAAISLPDSLYLAKARIYASLQQQALSLAYVDVVWILVATTAILIPIAYLMKKPDFSAKSTDVSVH
ncbi:MAG: DHA2 family efflux MFS transporter permease subunit [Acidobacteriaceae bacterium]